MAKWMGIFGWLLIIAGCAVFLLNSMMFRDDMLRLAPYAAILAGAGAVLLLVCRLLKRGSPAETEEGNEKPVNPGVKQAAWFFMGLLWGLWALLEQFLAKPEHRYPFFGFAVTACFFLVISLVIGIKHGRLAKKNKPQE